MNAPLEGTRVKRAEEQGWRKSWRVYNNEHAWGIIDALLEVAEEVEMKPVQVVINWLLQRPGVTAPIIGARTDGQLESSLGAVGWSLGTEQVDKLQPRKRRSASLPL